MKNLTMIIQTMALSCCLWAEDLSLYDCYDKAEQSHPLQQEKQNRQKVYELDRKNLNVRWLPSLNANANASYMSNVVRFDQVPGVLSIPIPSGTFPTMPKDQYKITLDVTQTIYDGGAIGAGKQVEKAMLQADLQKLEIELYPIHTQVNQVYFALLILQKQSELATIYHNEILERRSALQSGVKNGVILPGNVDILDAELLKIEQQLAELQIQEKKAHQILDELIGENMDGETLKLPVIEMPEKVELCRPELELFVKQKTVLEMNKKMVKSQQMPKAVIFGTYGYGRPAGSDFFNEEFDTYYIVGASLSWNIFNWNTTKRTRQALQAQQNIVDTKEDEFKRQITIALIDSKAEIERIKTLLQGDEKLIPLREKIKNAASSRHNNGIISSTDFLTELNAEREARINYEMHKIQYVQAQIHYLTISGQIQNNK